MAHQLAHQENGHPQTSGEESKYACVTVITTPTYVLGAMVLGHSVRRSGWPHALVVLVTKAVAATDRAELLRVWDRVIEVEPIANPNPPADLGFASFATTYTKLRVWEQTDYAAMVYLDADTIVLGDLTDLLGRSDFAAVPCGTLPDQFNTGMFLLVPSAERFADMLAKLPVLPSYDGGDQGFLNEYFADWFSGPAEHRLPLIYNVPRLLAFYATAWRKLDGNMRVVHFYGPQKPWNMKAGIFHRISTRVVNIATALEMSEPTPRTLWWEMHDDMQKSLRAQRVMSNPSHAASPTR